MNLPNYQDHENNFLQAMATQFCFAGKTRLVFVERFCEKNADSNDQTLANHYRVELLEGSRKEGAQPATVLRDRLKAICDKLEEEGCDFGATTTGRWKVGKAWLRREHFPQWAKAQGLIAETLLTFEQLWDQLKAKATSTNKMGMVLAPQLATAAMTHSEPSDYLKTVPLHSDILFKANLDCKGYLILLERDPSGAVCCVCPSNYAPDSRYTLNEMTLPQFPPSRYRAFTATEPGKEQLLALITQELPPLAWLEQNKQKILKLDRPHLQELWEYLQGVSASQVFYTDYRVIG